MRTGKATTKNDVHRESCLHRPVRAIRRSPHATATTNIGAGDSSFDTSEHELWPRHAQPLRAAARPSPRPPPRTAASSQLPVAGATTTRAAPDGPAHHAMRHRKFQVGWEHWPPYGRGSSGHVPPRWPPGRRDARRRDPRVQPKGRRGGAARRTRSTLSARLLRHALDDAARDEGYDLIDRVRSGVLAAPPSQMVGSGLVLTDNDAATAGRAGDRIHENWDGGGPVATACAAAAAAATVRASGQFEASAALAPTPRNVFYNAPKQSLEGSGVTVSDDDDRAAAAVHHLYQRARRRGCELGARFGGGAAERRGGAGGGGGGRRVVRPGERAERRRDRRCRRLRASPCAPLPPTTPRRARHRPRHPQSPELDGHYNAAEAGRSRSRRGPLTLDRASAGASSRLNALEAAGKDAEHFFGERVNLDAGGAHRRFKNAGQHGREAAAAATATPWEGKAAPAGVWSDKVPVGVANFGEPGAERGRSPRGGGDARFVWRRRGGAAPPPSVDLERRSRTRRRPTAARATRPTCAGQSRQSTDYKKALSTTASGAPRRASVVARRLRCTPRCRRSRGAAGAQEGSPVRRRRPGPRHALRAAGGAAGRATRRRRDDGAAARSPRAPPLTAKTRGSPAAGQFGTAPSLAEQPAGKAPTSRSGRRSTAASSEGSPPPSREGRFLPPPRRRRRVVAATNGSRRKYARRRAGWPSCR